MKKGILYGSIVGVGLVLSAVFINGAGGNDSYYTPRQNAGANDGYKGAAAWLHKMRANQVTGEIDPADVLKAQQQLAMNAKARKSTSALNLQWENMGPSNIGGRTRGFIIDQTNPDIMYAGAVSGGLFKSMNGGVTWTAVNDQQENLAVVSIAQAPDGTIYYGTGEGLYYAASGRKSQGIYGGGMFKSTDGGQTFQVISSTIPQSNGDWSSIGKIEIDPNNSNIIYAATTRALKVSQDGGATWTEPDGLGSVTDLTMDNAGVVWFRKGSQIRKSNGTPTQYDEVSTVGAGSNELPRPSGRARIAVAPSDNNTVYVVACDGNGDFDAAYQTKDGGANWTKIGERNMYLNPHSGGSSAQGDYDNAVSVDPSNPDRILVGGVTFWEWSSDDGWQLAASTAGANIGFQYYVHADMHHVVWHPTKKNVVFALNDGGVFKSTNNGETWKDVSNGYTSAQFYNIGVGLNGEMLGGTQDNGTLFVDPNNEYSGLGVRTNSISFKGSLMDGDGGYAAISHLNPQIAFKEMQYGILGRTLDRGQSFESFYDFARMDSAGAAGNLQASPPFGAFVTPFLLWEKLHDDASTDSLTFSADSLTDNFGFGGGDSIFDGTFVAPSFSKTTINGEVINTVAELLYEQFTMKAGNSNVVTIDAATQEFVDLNGNLSTNSNFTFYFDSANGNLPTLDYEVIFKTGINNGNVTAKVPVSYQPGDKVILQSATNDIDIIYELPNGANSTTNPQVRVQDDVQSAFFIGLTQRSLQGSTLNSGGGIWMTRAALTNQTGTPEWWHIGKLNGNNEQPSCMAVSGDGDVLYVGTSDGRLYRFSNISMARDSASADIDDWDKPDSTRANTSVIEKTLVRSFGTSRVITSIATHPFDKDKLIVTLGNYGNTDYVYYSSNATSTMPTLLQKDGGSSLPDFPVYSATFNFNDPNGTQVLLGTEYGVFTTEDISAATVDWVQENNGLANVPVFDLDQQLTIRYDLKPLTDHEGAIYAGTHGRGIFRTTSDAVIDYIGIKEPTLNEEVVKAKVLNVYPNPATSVINVELSLEGRTDVTINIRSITGQQVKSVKYAKLAKEVETLEVPVNNLAKGTYIITMQKGSEVISGKFIKK